MWKRNEFADTEEDGRIVYGDGWFCSDACYSEFCEEQYLGHVKVLSYSPKNGQTCSMPGCDKIYHNLDITVDLVHVEKFDEIDYFYGTVGSLAGSDPRYTDILLCADGLFAALNGSFDKSWDNGQNIKVRIRPEDALPEGSPAPNIEFDLDSWDDLIWRLPGERNERMLEMETSDTLAALGFEPGLYLLEIVGAGE